MTTMAAGRRRPELAAFLRSRRARITPADVGMPPGPRRRTPGLRREEVAQLSGVGVTWYTWLEQGRRINASPQVLDAVARTLRLDAMEREHLYHLAEVPYAPEPAAAAQSVGPEVLGILAAMDLPAAVYNSRYDVLAANGLYERMFPAVAGAGEQGRNVLWQLFSARACCCAMVNRDEELPILVATFRGAYGRHVGEPSWERLIRTLAETSEDFAEMWRKGDVAPPGSRIKVVQHASVGELRCVSTSLTITGMPETRIVVYTPADEGSRKLLDCLRTLADPLIGCRAHARPLSEERARQAALQVPENDESRPSGTGAG
ncbi:helix-turn-helix transcriptional regulator [Streptomyces sp. NPDC004134]|uniref:helix-turn-helix transcriptional regulator n=1 Tax=Streptomyces sp. NPDC004134 TaxID=3364691 RepID=UPI0036A9E954